MSFDRLHKEHLGCSHIAPGTEAEIDRLSRSVNCALKIGPFATDPDTGFVNAPRLTGRYGEPIPAFDELRRVALHPAHDRRADQGKTAFRHHFREEISKAQLVAQVLPHAKDNHFAVEMTSIEQPVDVFQLAHRLVIIKRLRVTDQRIGIAPQTRREASQYFQKEEM